MTWFYLSLAFLYIFSLKGELDAKKPKSRVGHPTISSRIVGGMNAALGEIPFQGSVQLNSEHICGCVIISPEWLLTAAHCVDRKNSDDMEILVGTNKLSSGGARYKVKMTITHDDYFTPEFSDPDIVNDIGLIHVQTPIQFNEKVQPIKYSTNEVKADELLQISGWGYLNKHILKTDNLQMLNVTSITNDECERRLFAPIHQSILCTFTREFLRGICGGDSGGPVVNFNNELVAIVNFAQPCAVGAPDGHARLSYFYMWIEKKIAKAMKNMPKS